MIRINERLAISERYIQITFMGSQGPGGQNVNRSLTAAHLRFQASNCPSLNGAMLKRLKELAGRRMGASGIVVIRAQRFRSQDMNRQDAQRRLYDLLDRASRSTPMRFPTSRPSKSVERRLAQKTKRSKTKRLRHVDQSNE